MALNGSFMPKEMGEGTLTGFLFNSSTLRLYVPKSWEKYSVNGAEFINKDQYATHQVPRIVDFIEEAKFSSDLKEWKNFENNELYHAGEIYLKIILNKTEQTHSQIILSGIGNEHFFVSNDPTQFDEKIISHAYRDIFIGSNQVNFHEPIFVKLDRKDALFLPKRFSPNGKSIEIPLGQPRLYQPLPIKIRRVS